MRKLRAWLLRLVGVFRKEQSEQELAEENAFSSADAH